MGNQTRYKRFQRPANLFPVFAPLTALPGVGDRLASVLKKKMGEHVIDLLWHLPVGVIDRSKRPPINEIKNGDVVTLDVTIVKHVKPPSRSSRPWQVFAHNDTGMVEIVYFRVRGDYVEKLLPVGERRLISGKAEWFRDHVQIAHPDHVINVTNANAMPQYEAVYPLTAGLTAKVLTKALGAAMRNIPQLDEWVDEKLKSSQRWPNWSDAIKQVHAPKEEADLSPLNPIRMRLAYDELLANQLALALVRQEIGKEKGHSIKGDGALRRQLIENLPFKLTQSQEEAIKEILKDQYANDRMLRLLQGDVGAGKTIVALIAMLNTMETGMQAALLAPTEILARQHHATISALLKPMGITPALLLGSTKASEKKKIINGLADGSIKIAIGTHALIADKVQFHHFGLAIIDEQHRFGVRQRLTLGEKGNNKTDILVMTATPIPRTLAMTVFGDMSTSQINEKPPGRLPVNTTALPLERCDEVIARLGAAISKGRRAYWICPLVDESDVLDIQAAEERFTILKAALPDAHPALVHGRMDMKTRDAAMESFRKGESKLLVATTVVEVGVDVPEASIMIIEHAERFGLAQLHQLRGRVGRGAEQSSCLLLYKPPLGAIAGARLKIMRESDDGFRIAEEDLRLRGGGEILGHRQSGDPSFILADLSHHQDLLKMAHHQARTILQNNPNLEGEEAMPFRQLLALFERDHAVTYLAGG